MANESQINHESIEVSRVSELLLKLFSEHHDQILFGLCIKGAIYELSIPTAPKVSICNDWIIVNLPHGFGHFHICPEKITKAELISGPCSANSDVPSMCGFRFWNQEGHQMMNIFAAELCPSGPFVSESSFIFWSKLRIEFSIEYQTNLGDLE